jgi:methyltransferase (TIGR00027 family)
MTRTDHDSWDLRSSVGTTATMVAAARAVATRQPHPIINDPWAAPLVEAVGIESLSRMVQLGTPPADAELDSDLRLQPVIDSFAVRTRFFDEFFTAATNSGIRQIVILAAGLDSRAYRLPWPHDTVIYEVDLPNVLSFKAGVFSRLGVTSPASYRPVACDLRDDWANALHNSGFDRSQSTAWSAEGLLMYLPPDAQDQLFDTITTLSAPRSRLATEHHPNPLDEVSRRTVVDVRWQVNGIDIDTSGLVYSGERHSVRNYLAAQGWSVAEQTRVSLFQEYGLSTPEHDAPMRNVVAVTAHLD